MEATYYTYNFKFFTELMFYFLTINLTVKSFKNQKINAFNIAL